jgi:hypothetical protein
MKAKRACELRVMNSANALYVSMRVPNAGVRQFDGFCQLIDGTTSWQQQQQQDDAPSRACPKAFIHERRPPALRDAKHVPSKSKTP